jgi:hypothetical protein
MTPISHRESYIFDESCRFCADDTEELVAQVNTQICPECFTWLSNSLNPADFGITSI